MKPYEEYDSDIIGYISIELAKLELDVEEKETSLSASKGLRFERGGECVASKGAEIEANDGNIFVELTKGFDFSDVVDEKLKFTDEDEAIKAVRDWVYEGEENTDAEMGFWEEKYGLCA